MGISGTQGQGTKTGKAHERRSGKMVVVYVSTCNPGMDIARAVVCGRLFVGYPKAHPPRDLSLLGQQLPEYPLICF